MLFAAGCAAADGDGFERLDAAQVRRWRRISWIALPTLLPLVLLAWAMRPDAAVPAASQQRWPRRAYGIFAVHPLAVAGVALAWCGVVAPPLLKWAVTGTPACVVSYRVVGVLLRVPAVRRVL